MRLKKGRLHPLTGACAAVGVRVLGRDGVVKAGVVDTESYFDAREYLEELHCTGAVALKWSDQELSG
jgi:hypothetical protein